MKFLPTIAALAIGVLVLAGCSIKYDQVIQGGSGDDENYVIAGSRNATSSAKTYSYVATSTDPKVSTTTISTVNDNVSHDICVIASSTTAVVQWRYSFSQDGTNYYGEDTASTSIAALTHGPATTTHSWTPASVSEICKRVAITGVNSNFIKVEFLRGAAFQNYSLYSEITPKNIY